MLGQKEICGLIFILCCCLARSLPRRQCDICLINLQEHANALETATKSFVDVPSNLISTIADQLPSCNSSLNKTDILKAFHTLFQQLSATIDGARRIENLDRILGQQKVCLQYYKVPNSSINITYDKKNETDQKILLVRASERYKCLMQKLHKDLCKQTFADAAEGRR